MPSVFPTNKEFAPDDHATAAGFSATQQPGVSYLDMWVVVREDWDGNRNFEPFRVPISIFRGYAYGTGILRAVQRRMRELHDGEENAIVRHGLKKVECLHMDGKYRCRRFRLLHSSGKVFLDERTKMLKSGYFVEPDENYSVESGTRELPYATVDFYEVSWQTYFRRMFVKPTKLDKDVMLMDGTEYMEWKDMIEPKPSRVERWEDFGSESGRFLMEDSRAVHETHSKRRRNDYGDLDFLLFKDADECGLFGTVREYARSKDKVPNAERWIAFGDERVVPVKGPQYTLRHGLGNTLEVAKALMVDDRLEGRAYVLGLLYLDMLLGRMRYGMMLHCEQYVFVCLS